MSKPKGKDKKPQNYDQLQKQYDEQKRELLDATFTIKKLQQRMNLLTQQNFRLQKERQNQFMCLNQKIEQLTIKNETNQKRLMSMRNDLTNSEVQNKKLANTINLLERNMSDERVQKIKQYEQMRKNYTFQIAKYQNMLNDYKLYMTERDTRQKQINQLIESREIQIANRIRQVADKEREKVQATDKIRDEMGNKIRQMRQNLLSLKKQQLQTTTRLTMLQNHQLTTQLQYQSKQTQKIVFKNQQLEKTLAKLRQDLDIHKQVEDQLAKRSHFSKGIIKKLHARVEELEEELGKKRSQDVYDNSSQDSITQKKVKKQKVQKPQKVMAQAIDKQLQRSQKKYAELQCRYDGLQRQKEEIYLRWETGQRIKNELFNTILQSYNDLLGDQAQSSKQNNNIMLDLEKVRQRNPKDWTKQQLRGVLQIILLTCQSYLTKSNLTIPSLRRIIIDGDNDKQLKQMLPKLSTERDKRNHNSASENRLESVDVCTLAKQQLSRQKYSINIASKMVSSKLRQWGKPVSSKSRGTLSRKYQLSSSYRN